MRRISFVAAVLGAFVLGAVVTATAIEPRIAEPTTIHVVERPISDVVIDTGEAGDTSGDLLTFANPLYDETNEVKVGRNQGECIRISPQKGSWECRWTAWVEGGSIMVEGPFFDAKPSVLAITGGTGTFRNARGSMSLTTGTGGTFHFVYHVIP